MAFVGAAIFKLNIESFHIGGGKTLYSHKICGVELKVGIIPFIVSVSFPGNHNSPENADTIENRPGWHRFVIPTAGTMVPFIVAFVILGSSTFGEMRIGFVNIFKGTFSPFNEAQTILSGYSDQIHRATPFVYKIGAR